MPIFELPPRNAWNRSLITSSCCGVTLQSLLAMSVGCFELNGYAMHLKITSWALKTLFRNHFTLKWIHKEIGFFGVILLLSLKLLLGQVQFQESFVCLRFYRHSNSPIVVENSLKSVPHSVPKISFKTGLEFFNFWN